VRATNALVLLLGLTLIAYGGYIVGVCKLSPVAEAALALGVLDVGLGLVAVTCYRTLFALRLYGLVMTFLVIAEFVLAVLFLTNSPSVSGLTTCSSDKALDFARTQNALSWIILAVAAFQSVSLFFVFAQVCSVDKVSGGDARARARAVCAERRQAPLAARCALRLTRARTRRTAHTHTHTLSSAAL
jgi:hypothetical protein